MNINKGAVFGLGLVASLINVAMSLAIVLAYSWMQLKKVCLPNEYRIILALVMIKVFWILGIYLGFSNKDFYFIIQVLAPDIMLLTMIFILLNPKFLDKMFKPIILLFFVDFMFNLSIYLLGADPLGRGGGNARDDMFPRLTGVFGHPYYSINIAFIMVIIGIFLKKNFLIFLALLTLFFTGSLRGPVTGFAIFSVWLMLRLRINVYLMLILMLLFVALVFLATFYSASLASYETGNYLRVVAWVNSVDHIISNPFLGTHTFLMGTFEHMSSKAIIDYGIAESLYLQYGLDFGLIPSLVALAIFTIIFYINVQNYYKSNIERQKRESMAISILTAVVLIDSFYGTIYGSVLTTFFYLALAISYGGKHFFRQKYK